MPRRALVADLALVLERLASVYGEPPALPQRSVFEWLVYDNVAYLVDDARRDEAYALLRKRTALTPEALAQVPEAALQGVAGKGILPEHQAEKLRRIAQLAQEDDLKALPGMPLEDAKRVLMRYPSIGEPGAEKILLFARLQPLLGLESNGVRVLSRLGLIAEGKSYAATYRQVQNLGEQHTQRGIDWLIRAHQLLRQHGQELCKRTRPKCEQCPLTDACAYYAVTGAAGAPSSDHVSPR